MQSYTLAIWKQDWLYNLGKYIFCPCQDLNLYILSLIVWIFRMGNKVSFTEISGVNIIF